MKNNLKTRPKPEDTDNAYDYANENEKWFEGFEKKFRGLIPEKWVMENAPTLATHSEVLRKFIEQEILGE